MWKFESFYIVIRTQNYINTLPSPKLDLDTLIELSRLSLRTFCNHGHDEDKSK